MSHWKTFSNDVLVNTNQQILGKAVRELGLGIDDTVKTVMNAYGQENVDMALTKDGEILSLGFKKVGDKLELIGDFYGTGVVEETFMNKLSQEYTKEDILNKVENSIGFNIDGTVKNKDGEYEILISQYA